MQQNSHISESHSVKILFLDQQRINWFAVLHCFICYLSLRKYSFCTWPLRDNPATRLPEIFFGLCVHIRLLLSVLDTLQVDFPVIYYSFLSHHVSYHAIFLLPTDSSEELHLRFRGFLLILVSIFHPRYRKSQSFVHVVFLSKCLC